MPEGVSPIAHVRFRRSATTGMPPDYIVGPEPPIVDISNPEDCEYEVSLNWEQEGE